MFNLFQDYSVFLSVVPKKPAPFEQFHNTVAAGTQKEMVLGIRKFVSEANEFLSETSWGYGGRWKLCIFKKISSWIVSKLQAKRLSQQIFEKVK